MSGSDDEFGQYWNELKRSDRVFFPWIASITFIYLDPSTWLFGCHGFMDGDPISS